MAGKKVFYKQGDEIHFSDDDGGGEATTYMIAELIDEFDESTREVRELRGEVERLSELVRLYRTIETLKKEN